MGVSHFIYPLISCSTFRLFLLLAFLQNAAMNIHVYDFEWTYVFINPGHIPWNGNAVPYGNSTFKLLRSCQSLFQSKVCEGSNFPISSPTHFGQVDT